MPHTQNGVSERLNRTLIELCRSMLSYSKLPKKFWAEAIATSVHVKNRFLFKIANKTPYECLYNVKPDVSNLRVFGC